MYLVGSPQGRFDAWFIIRVLIIQSLRHFPGGSCCSALQSTHTISDIIMTVIMKCIQSTSAWFIRLRRCQRDCGGKKEKEKHSGAQHPGALSLWRLAEPSGPPRWRLAVIAVDLALLVCRQLQKLHLTGVALNQRSSAPPHCPWGGTGIRRAPSTPSSLTSSQHRRGCETQWAPTPVYLLQIPFQ